MPRSIPPQHSRRGGRLGGGCASGTPSADPLTLASIGERDAVIEPPTNIRGAAVVPVEGAPPVFPPLTLVPWPLSGRESPPEILHPIFAAWRSSRGRVRLRHSPRRPSSCGLHRGGRRRINPPPNIRGAAIDRAEGAPPALPCRLSSLGLCPGGRCRDRSYPQYLQRCYRAGGGYVPPTSPPSTLIPWPPSEKETPAILGGGN